GATASWPWITKPHAIQRRGHHAASMGPRPHGRGSRRTRSWQCLPCRSFNGATASWPWITFGTGADRCYVGRLQWGHGLMAVDHNAGQDAVVTYASVLQWGHGLMAVDHGRPSCRRRLRI